MSNSAIIIYTVTQQLIIMTCQPSQEGWLQDHAEKICERETCHSYLMFSSDLLTPALQECTPLTALA